MGRSVFAVVVGYLVVAVATFLTFAAAGYLPRPSAEAGAIPYPSFPRQLLFLAASVVYAIAGGYLTAALARNSPVRHALSLGLFMAALAFVSLASRHAKEPFWFQVALLLVAVPAAVCGGWLRVCSRTRGQRGRGTG